MINGGSRRLLLVTVAAAAALGITSSSALAGSTEIAVRVADCEGCRVSAAVAVASRVPGGASVWIKPVGGTYQMLRLWRSGAQLRLYRDEGNYPGDGTYCSWGTLRGKTFTGKEQRLAPDPVAARYTIRRNGGKLKVLGLTGSRAEDGVAWRRGSVQKYFQLVPDAAGNTGKWCRTFTPVG